MKKYKVWYSESTNLRSCNEYINIARLDDDKEVKYTELTRLEDTPTIKADDFVCLGVGVYLRSEPNPNVYRLGNYLFNKSTGLSMVNK